MHIGLAGETESNATYTGPDNLEAGRSLLAFMSTITEGSATSNPAGEWQNGSNPCSKTNPWINVVCTQGVVTGIDFTGIPLTGALLFSMEANLPILVAAHDYKAAGTCAHAHNLLTR